jgi:hypothetical protein
MNHRVEPDITEEDEDADAVPPMSDSESLAPARQPGKRSSSMIQPDPADGDDKAVQLQRLKQMTAPLQVMIRALGAVEELTQNNVPCVSNSPTKDRVSMQETYTDDGRTLIKKSKTKHIAAYNAELVALEGAIKRVTKAFNAACEKQYELQEYEKELAATKVVRREEAALNLEHANMLLRHKTEHTRGFAARMERRQAHKKRKVMSDSEIKQTDVFDLL